MEASKMIGANRILAGIKGKRGVTMQLNGSAEKANN